MALHRTAALLLSSPRSLIQIDNPKPPKLDGLPQIIDEYNLYALLGTSAQLPTKMMFNMENQYKKFWINKRNHSEVYFEWKEGMELLDLREICAPSKALKSLHWKLNKLIFSKMPTHDANFAYMKARNISHAAAIQLPHDVLIKVDLKNFFPSHNRWYIRNRLMDITGYPEAVCSVLASLCTLNNQMPQGAPCSPLLSIVLNYDMDCDLQALADQHKLTYTRYADDMTFGGKERSSAELWQFIRDVAATVRPFKVNWKKVEIQRNKETSYPVGFTLESKEAFKDILEYLGEDYQSRVKGNKVTFFKQGEFTIEDLESVKEFIGTKAPDVLHSLKVKRRYVQKIKHMLGLNLTNDVHMPRYKFERLRVEAMLYGKNTPNFNKSAFRGRLAFLRMVDPKKADIIDKIVNKFRNAAQSAS